MTAVLRSPSHLPSSPSSSFSCTTANDGPRQTSVTLLSNDPSASVVGGEGGEGEGGEREEEEGSSVGRKGQRGDRKRREAEAEEQLSLLALLVAVFRKSLVGSCSAEREKDLRSMEIGWPTNVRHVAHVTFDRFHGFLGLPVEFEPEVPRRAPSASANVFGVSAESMQCSFDSRGNSVPTILLLMQRRLYAQGGLQAEGIFRINAENSQEEHVRDQLNCGIVPDGIDVHCLAGLIKAWFRELPTGVLDPLTSEQVMQCQIEEECVHLVRLLPPTEAALLDWAVNLMADVVVEEHHNKMNARNIAMVFAPNMTQMADPLTALMYAVQVMNFLKTLIERTLRERHESLIEATSASHSEPSDEDGHHSPSRLGLESQTEEDTKQDFVTEVPVLENPSDRTIDSSTAEDAADRSRPSPDKAVCEGTGCSTDDQPCEAPTQTDDPKASGSETAVNGPRIGGQVNSRRTRIGYSSNVKHNKGAKMVNGQLPLRATTPTTEKSKGISLMSRINSRAERVEAWR